MQFAVHVPLNSLSFGQVSFNLLYEFYKMGLNPHIFKASDHQIDFSSYNFEQEFIDWVVKNHNEAFLKHNRDIPSIRVWHINDSIRTYSNKQILLTFHETDQITAIESNLLKSSTVCVTSKYTNQVFENSGIKSEVVPLGFDSRHFHVTNKKYFDDNRITFNLCGKYEKRKHHAKIIKAWISKFGKDRRYSLQCAINNAFYQDPNELKSIYSSILDGKPVFNVAFLASMPKNGMYNDFLNSADIILGMSGAEGWGLPEFQSVALGKHAVILNATAYKEWANKDNSILIEPKGKLEVYDGKFFSKGAPFNQGNIFDFNEDEFIAGCEEAIKRVEADRINHEGLKIQDQFKYSNTASKLLSLI
jgi:glycosyltransferase involved in cell wall biosynthesis